jgi:hypothetical protein
MELPIDVIVRIPDRFGGLIFLGCLFKRQKEKAVTVR